MSRLVLIAGQSHAGCLHRALRGYKGATDYRIAVRGHEADVGGIALSLKDGGRIANPAILALLDRAADGRPAQEMTVLSVFGGVGASILSLAYVGVGPVLAEGFAEGEPVNPRGFRLVPQSLARAELARLSQPLGVVLTELLARGYKRILHLEAPPPVRDSAFVYEKLPEKTKAFYRGKAEGRFRITSPAQRLAFWRLQTAATRRLCAELGVTYVSPPQASIDEDGYLAPDSLHDAVHGNALYGERVLAKIDELLEAA